jgi:hypothetical protein
MRALMEERSSRMLTVEDIMRRSSQDKGFQSLPAKHEFRSRYFFSGSYDPGFHLDPDFGGETARASFS